MAELISIRGLEKTVKALRSLPAELGSKGGGPIRGALFAAGRLIRDDAQSRAPIGNGTPKPGNLRANIFLYRDRNPQSSGAAEHYIIGVRTGRKLSRKRKFKFSGGLRVLTGGDAWYWFWVEFGTKKQPAQPFMRPAFEANKRRAVVVFGRELRKMVSKAAARARK
ncbi:MAG: HK97 gp10 family phage protein [Xanthomonadales bacterium]|nr:HK97 gp10 family phage protein [Xanthomonadales bacterium]